MFILMKHFMQENKSTFGHKPIPQKALRQHYNKDNGKEIHNEEETVSLSVPSLEKIQSSSLVMCDCCEYFAFYPFLQLHQWKQQNETM